MANIHPTALVDKKAVIADDVQIGPYSIIGPHVKIGSKTVIGPYVQITNNVEIGSNNQIFHGSCIGENGQDLTFNNPEPRIVIGDNNIFRENMTVHQPSKPGNATKIGNENYLMCNVHIAHDVVIGDKNIIAATTALGGYVEIENNVYISGLVGVHQFVKIGRYAIIGAGTPALLDVPPYSMLTGSPGAISGLNMIGMKRAKFSSSKIQCIKNIYKYVFMRGHSTAKSTELLEKELLLKYEPGTEENAIVQHYLNFLKASNRGIAPKQK